MSDMDKDNLAGTSEEKVEEVGEGSYLADWD